MELFNILDKRDIYFFCSSEEEKRQAVEIKAVREDEKKRERGGRL